MLWLWLSIWVAWGQVNYENMAAKVVEDGVGVQVGLGGASVAGNLRMMDLRGQAAVQYRRSVPGREEDDPPFIRDRAILSLNGSYLAVNGTPFFDRRLAHASYARFFSPRVGLGMAVQYQNNLLLLLEGRVTGGGGVRLVFVQRERVEVNAGLGGMLEYEVRNVDPDGPDARTTLTPRLVARLSSRVAIVPDRLTWMHTVYAEPRVDDWRNTLMVDYNTVEAHVSKVVSMTADLQLRYDSNAPSTLKAFDQRLTWGLRFRWAARPDPEQLHH